jgi:taurine--2-oxoglutarate transaminase
MSSCSKDHTPLPPSHRGISVVGTNGIIIPPDGYMQGLRQLCTKYGIMLICDEVMSGFGRTGKWFAVDHGVTPDI